MAEGHQCQPDRRVALSTRTDPTDAQSDVRENFVFSPQKQVTKMFQITRSASWSWCDRQCLVHVRRWGSSGPFQYPSLYGVKACYVERPFLFDRNLMDPSCGW